MQWRHEQQQRQVERLTTLYLDMLARMDAIHRGQQQYILRGDRPMGDPRDDDEYEERQAAYDSRVELFGSRSTPSGLPGARCTANGGT